MKKCILATTRAFSLRAKQQFITVPKSNYWNLTRSNDLVKTKNRINPLFFQPIRTMFIQTETTPNDNAIKFLPGKEVMGDKGFVEYINAREAMVSPLGKKLFQIDGVQSILFGKDFISVNKDDSISWPQLKPEIFATLMDFFASGKEIIGEESELASDTKILPEDSETVQMIKELLETRIRPSIQEDGGDIEYLGFENGIVKLKLRGACRTCDSSTVTLKHGIQNMLMHYIPEVEGVEQQQDELDKISHAVFESMEGEIKVRKN